jgi:hypothetical protein
MIGTCYQFGCKVARLQISGLTLCIDDVTMRTSTSGLAQHGQMTYTTLLLLLLLLLAPHFATPQVCASHCLQGAVQGEFRLPSHVQHQRHAAHARAGVEG